MMLISETYKFLKERLIMALSSKAVFFVGAGISVPSGLPAFDEVTEKVITTILSGEVALEPEDLKLLIKRLRPEVVYQIGIDELKSEVLLSLEVLEGGNPNVYHFFLAEALKKGSFIFTTNVDNLIEKACQRIGLIQGKDFQVCYGRDKDKDFKDYFDQIEAGEKPKPCIFKLHGSIDESDAKSKYYGVQFALRQVGKGLYERRQQVLKFFQKNFDFWFLGYSCRDDFSVVPAFITNENGKDKKTYWFDYDPGPLIVCSPDSERLRWELEREEKKPLDQERDISLININELLQRRGKSYRFKGDLGKLLQTKLCPELGIKFDMPIYSAPREMLALGEWVRQQVPTWKRLLFVARLFEEALEWEKAIGFCEKAAEAPLVDQLAVKLRKADIYYKEADTEKAKDAFLLCQQCADSLCAGPARASQKAMMSNILRRSTMGKDWRDEAEKWGRKAVEEFEFSMSKSDREASLEYARSLNIYGLSLYSKKEYNEARELIKHSFCIKKRLGDIDGRAESENALSIVSTQEGRALAAAGDTAQAQAKFEGAIDHAKKALDARRKVGNWRGYAQNCRNLAWPHRELMKISDKVEERKKNFDKAKEGYEAGIRTWLRIAPPPATEVLHFTNMLVNLYKDFYGEREWTLKGLQSYRFIFDELSATSFRLRKKDAQTAQENLLQIKEWLRRNPFYEE